MHVVLADDVVRSGLGWSGSISDLVWSGLIRASIHGTATALAVAVISLLACSC
jgi:hypothetical protein